jgi:hypothetical protein
MNTRALYQAVMDDKMDKTNLTRKQKHKKYLQEMEMFAHEDSRNLKLEIKRVCSLVLIHLLPLSQIKLVPCKPLENLDALVTTSKLDQAKGSVQTALNQELWVIYLLQNALPPNYDATMNPYG